VERRDEVSSEGGVDPRGVRGKRGLARARRARQGRDSAGTGHCQPAASGVSRAPLQDEGARWRQKRARERDARLVVAEAHADADGR
jgi:hypothetical protein